MYVCVWCACGLCVKFFHVQSFQFEIASSNLSGRVVMGRGTQTEQESMLVVRRGFGLHFRRREWCNFVLVGILVVVLVLMTA